VLWHVGRVAAPIPVSVPPSLLVVEDDAAFADLLADLLGDEGYSVDLARDGQAGLHRGLTRRYDAMVVDRGLPAVEGTDLVRRLRSRGVTCPVLLLTARGTVTDRVEGLDAGAEDYLVKPFEVPELLARIRALLRRHVDRAESLPLGRRRLDVTGRRVVDDAGAEPDVELSGRESGLLHALAAAPTRVFTREELLDRVFDAADSPGAVDTYVHYLRRKLGRDVVHTVHGLGYRMGTA
jgi:two-component system response regulator QseB